MNYNIDEPQNHHAKRKDPDVKDYINTIYIYVQCPEKTNLDRKADQWLPVVGGGNWVWKIFVVTAMFLN